ncbi:MAG: single-stranded DNA-binding protein, partial [Actinobacteria bacterium]|nr:single-stranded DNA-binding protein [Actinomycetota bacterium]
MTLSNLKKGSSLDKLKKAVEASSAGNTGGKGADERFWQPEVDAAGNGYAVIRFLDTPAVDGEDGLPWVQIWSHGFQGPGGWYIENSLTTLGKTDPVSEHNTVLWNSGIEANKEIARKQKRKLTYIANVLVISDAKRPHNEGKVFLYKFGKKIFDKIKEQLEPQFADETPMNPFDFWKGANFKIKIRNVEGYRNYDKSEFESPAALFNGDDAQIEKVWKSAHSLKDFLKPENFKSYDELKAKLDKVLGAGGAAGVTAKRVDDEEASAPVIRSAPAKKVTAE